MKRTVMAALIALIAIAFAAPAIAEMSVEEIVQKSLDRERGKNKIVELQMVLEQGGSKKMRAFKQWQLEGKSGTKKLLRFTEPAQMKDTAFLSWENKDRDDDQWLYMASRKQVRRIASSDKTSSFVGSDLTYEDLGVQKASDRTHELLGTPLVDGKQCWLVESVLKQGKASGYHKTRTWIIQDNFVALKIEMYDQKDKLLKTMECKEYKEVDGVWTMMEIKVGPADQKTSTTLVIKSVKYGEKLDDSLFSKENLDKF